MSDDTDPTSPIWGEAATSQDHNETATGLTTDAREHDPLCPMFCDEDDERDDAYCCLDCDGYGCECWMIRRVRADERERCIRIVISVTERFVEEARGIVVAQEETP